MCSASSSSTSHIAPSVAPPSSRTHRRTQRSGSSGAPSDHGRLPRPPAVRPRRESSLRHAAAARDRRDHPCRHRFAVDSIPAAFAVTRDPVVIWSANAFALLGLGSLLAVVELLVRRLRYLDETIAVILGFVGIKILTADLVHISDLGSLASSPPSSQAASSPRSSRIARPPHPVGGGDETPAPLPEKNSRLP